MNKKDIRVIPTCIEYKKEDGTIHTMDLLSNKDFSYIMYGYLQSISYYDAECGNGFRKIYTEDFSIRKTVKALKMGNQKVQKHLNLLREIKAISREVYEDVFGKYYKLYTLTCKTFVKLDLNNEYVLKLFNECDENGIRTGLLYKACSDAYNGCFLTAKKICVKIGLSTQHYSLNKVKAIQKNLYDMNIIFIEKNKTQSRIIKNIYKCNL